MKDELTKLQDSIHVLDGFDPKVYQNAEPPMVSLYVPVHHSEREERRDEWDGGEFKDLMKEAQRDLERDYDKDAYKGIVEKMAYILDHPDHPLWLNAGAGLAFLINNEDAYVFNLDFAVDPVVVVGDSYYMKPLIRNFQYGMSYYLLLLNTDRFSLLKGDYNGVHYVKMPKGIFDEFAETFPEYDGYESALDYYSLEDHMSPYHDHKSRNEVTQEEAEKFFRYVDKVMNDKLVRNDPTPVILVTASEHEAMFRKLCTFPTLLPQGIAKDARTLSGTELRDDAVKIMEGIRDEQLQKVIDHYNYEQSKGKATDKLPDVGFALTERKVATLLIEKGKGMPGTYNQETGEVDYDGAANPTDDKQLDPASPDIADAFAQAALKQDAQVYVLPADKMPGESGIAAIYRF